MKLKFFICIVVASLILFSCGGTKSKDLQLRKMESYDDLWKKVTAKEADGLPKSTLEIVDTIYAQAKKDSNGIQIVKALLYKAKYTGELDENGVLSSLSLFESEIKTTSDPIAKSIVHSLLAELYYNYFMQNAWEINQRTPIAGNSDPDIESWSKVEFLQNVRYHYHQSIVEPGLTKALVRDYTPLLTDEKNTDKLRPSLYDVLLHRVIDHYLNSGANADEADEDIVLDQEILFRETSDFIKLKLAESTNSVTTVIKLLQDAEAFHADKSDKSALIDVVQKRLQYVYDHFTGDGKDIVYEKSLNGWISNYKGTKESAPFILNLANFYRSQGYLYQPDAPDTILKPKLIQALTLYRKIEKDFPGTSEAKAASNTIKEIMQPNLSAMVEEVNVLDKPFRVLVSYKNITNVYYKVMPITDEVRMQMYGRPVNEYLSTLLKINPSQQNKVTLPSGTDLMQHNVEIKVDALPIGMYAIVLSDNESFDRENPMALVFTHISNLAYLTSANDYIYQRLKNTKTKEFIVVDRNGGAPMADVSATFYEISYDAGIQRNKLTKSANAKSTVDGKIIANLPQNKQFNLKLEKGTDRLWLDYAFSNYSHYNDQKPSAQNDILFFTDRTLYRPGQTIYFKGLAIKREPDGKVAILKNKKIEISFRDVNGQEMVKKSFVSNDFGSINGTFMAPATGLLGSMSLNAEGFISSTQIQVEEYKRPKFEITFDTNTIVSRLNEEVTITGIAKNYSGNTVDQAMVKYKVTRQQWIRPLPWWNWKIIMPYDPNPKIIAKGNSSTDALGKFKIPFKALAKPSDDLKNNDISYNYNIEVEITDFTGETRTNIFTTRIGNKNLVLSSSLKAVEIKDSLKSITVQGADLNGNPLTIEGEFTLNKIKQSDKTFRSSYWKADEYLISESDYHQWFPLDPYKNENQISEWSIEKQIIKSNFDSKVPIVINPTLSIGLYKLVVKAKDNFGKESTEDVYFWVHDPVNNLFPTNENFSVLQDKSLLLPDKAINYTLINKTNPQYILQSSTIPTLDKWIINSNFIKDQVSLSESQRGNQHSLHWTFVRDNRVYNKGVSFGLDWSNKDLEIQTISFRDKLLPGKDEEWKLKISGKDKEKFISEIVAGMYDQSLDALYPHSWQRDLFRMNYIEEATYAGIGFNTKGSEYIYYRNEPYEEIEGKLYRNLNWFGFTIYGGRGIPRGGVMYKSRNAMPEVMSDAMSVPPPVTAQGKMSNEESIKATSGKVNDDAFHYSPANKPSPSITPRKNLNETVFFYPHIKTDLDGNFILKFKMNEALTRWRLMLFGHTQDLKSGYYEKEIVTQKDLMVFPNGPRFLRQNDKMEFPAKVSNLSEKIIHGNARLELFDPVSGRSLDRDFNLSATRSSFSIPAGQSGALTWTLIVPDDYTGVLGYRVIAESGTMADGEENVIPVLTNRKLVTETMPFTVRAKDTRSFTFEALASKINSSTLKSNSFTLECTANPLWYAVQSLPYLMEFPHECTEQIVNRYYANALAESVLKANPGIKHVFDEWAKKDLLKSPLQKNEELKTAILHETPWVKDALSEAEQQKMIAVLFDINRMANEKQKAFDQIKNRQLSNGGFPWFEGRDDWYITQYVIEDLGHLKKLGILNNELDEVLLKAVNYCDRELKRYFEESKKWAKNGEVGLSEIAIHYLYARSFYKDWPIEDIKAFDHFIVQSEKDWLKQNIYNQGMIALALHRWQSKSTGPSKILASLNEKAQHKDDLGMYWKFEPGYRYFELPIETQALLIEAFNEISKDQAKVDEMRIWLLKNKQTSSWPTTKATAAAIYALMLNGNTEWINETVQPQITLGTEKVLPPKEEITPGSGYYKLKKSSNEINISLSKITVNNKNNHIIWGAAFWQYFEDLNKITTVKSVPLSISKKLYVESINGSRKELKSVNEYSVGEKIIIRLELKADRPMDYLHLQDMRAAGVEPIQVISQYKYQSGLGYYESTKDLATHFFIDHISAGTFVLEYPVRVAQKGSFSNGISTLQCMYAPEFSSHTGGEVVLIR